MYFDHAVNRISNERLIRAHKGSTPYEPCRDALMTPLTMPFKRHLFFITLNYGLYRAHKGFQCTLTMLATEFLMKGSTGLIRALPLMSPVETPL